MESRVKIFGHPLHPMLIVVPSSMFPLALFFDVLSGSLDEPALFVAGFWILLAGLVTGIAAALVGIFDMAAIPDGTKAHSRGLRHAIVGSTLLVAYAVALVVRWPVGSTDAFTFATLLDVVGVALVSIQGWLGGELVYKHHLAVLSKEEGADPTPFTTAKSQRGVAEAARRRGASRP